jgi:hypothetical protein
VLGARKADRWAGEHQGRVFWNETKRVVSLVAVPLFWERNALVDSEQTVP